MAAARLSIGKAILFWLLAIVAGPPLGGIGFYLLLILKAVSGLDANSVFPDNDPLATIWAIAVFSYLLGIIPAALAALPLAIVIARFVPIVRTFAPFVAGVGAMSYPRYLAFSVFGAVLWVASCTLAGYFLGNIPVVRDNFELTVLAIIAVSLLPPVIEWARTRSRAHKAG